MYKNVKIPSNTSSPAITEGKEAEEEMRVKNNVIASSINAVAIADLEGNLAYVNHAFLRMWGYDDEKEVLGKNAVEFWQIAEEPVEVMQIAMYKGGWIGELAAKRKDGSSFNVQLSASVARDEAGKPICRLGSFVDITERKQMEEKLRESEEKWRSLVENAPNLIIIVGPDHTIQFINKTMPGIAAGSLEGRSIYDYIQPEYHNVVKATIKRVFGTGEPGSYLIRGAGSDAGSSWYETQVGPIKSDERVVAVTLITLDVTERKRAEEELKSSEEQLRILFEFAPDAYYLNDLKGNFVDGNKAAEEITGYKRDELIGKSFLKLKLLSPGQIPKAAALLVQNALGRATGPDELTLTRKDGTQVQLGIRTFPVKIKDKTLVLGIARDITERKRMEHDLRERMKELQCLYDIANINERPGITLNEIYQEVANLLQPSWQYPEITCARITLGDKEFKTNNFRATEWGQWASINIKGHKEGAVEVYYLEARPEIDEGPFLKGERLLIDAVAERLRQTIERKRAEEILHESEERYRRLFELSPIGITTLDMKGVITSCNSAVYKEGGYSENELVGKHFSKIAPIQARDIPQLIKVFSSIIKGKAPKPFEVAYQHKDGAIGWTEVHIALLEAGGRKLGIQVLQRDITERKRAEGELQESERKYRTLFENLNDSVFLGDVETGRILDTNKQGEILLGRTRKEIIGMHQSELHPPGMANEYRQRFATHVHKGRAADYEGEAVRKDGSIVPVSISATAVTIGGKQLIVGLFHDITERKRAEERVEHLNAVLRAIRNVNQLIAREKDRDRLLEGVCGNLIETRGYYNAWVALLDEFGGFLTHSEAGLGEEFLPMVEQLKRGQLPGCSQRALRQSEVVITEDPLSTCPDCPLVAKHHGGGVMTVRLESGGKVYGMLSVSIPRAIIVDEEEQSLVKEIASDIAFALHSIELEEERKRMEQALQKRNKQLIAQQQELIEKTAEVEKATRLKSEFLANMSHELRTPLNIIIGFSELMVDGVPGKINKEQRQCLNDTLASSRHLLNLINEVLDISKIESGKIELKLKDIVLNEMVKPLTRTMMPIVAPRKQSLDIEIEEGLPPVHTDKAKLREVLLNLVDNSSKFTPAGGKLKIEAVREGDWCRVNVIDNGIGIKEEDQERIFEPFCGVDDSLVTERNGTGLGLAVVKQIVERHGGRVWVESEWGKGSQFSFTMPLARAVSKSLGENR